MIRDSQIVGLGDLSGNVAANIVSRYYHRNGHIHIFASGKHSILVVSNDRGDPSITAINRDGVHVKKSLIDAVEEALIEKSTVGFCVISDVIMTHLDKTGYFTTLNRRPIYIRDDRYYDVF